MARNYQPIDLSRVRTISIAGRSHKVDSTSFAGLPDRGATAAELLTSLPNFLGARELRAVASVIVAARKADRPAVFALGAHVIKVGCSPVIIDLMRRGWVTALACNGATAIHDVEVAVTGQTSEDVAANLASGRFGMVKETAEFFALAALHGAEDDVGLGRAVGRMLAEQKPEHRSLSILAAAQELGLPATVHVALGTDTIHMHPQVDPAALGRASGIDFRLLCSVVADLGASSASAPGGVWCNIGSAVVLPEVFLKAVTVARNLGANLDAMVTANFDMLRHYRPRENVVSRPVQPGHGHEVIGHHEILLPLLRQLIVESA
jgi:hypothetical protein